jgi:hypothetical protein
VIKDLKTSKFLVDVERAFTILINKTKIIDTSLGGGLEVHLNTSDDI